MSRLPRSQGGSSTHPWISNMAHAKDLCYLRKARWYIWGLKDALREDGEWRLLRDTSTVSTPIVWITCCVLIILPHLLMHSKSSMCGHLNSFERCWWVHFLIHYILHVICGVDFWFLETCEQPLIAWSVDLSISVNLLSNRGKFCLIHSWHCELVRLFN